jgi:hypothetical protein
MAINNPDGTPYLPTGSMQQFDPENPEFDLFNVWDQEAIEIGGSPILYYEVSIQANTMDPLYLEDRGKLWSPKPICLYGFYDPNPNIHDSTVWGGDSPGELMLEFNYQYILEKLGHPPVVGSRMHTVHRKQNWVVRQNNVEEYKLWGQLRLQCMCAAWQSSLSDNSDISTQAKPDVSFNSIRSNR